MGTQQLPDSIQQNERLWRSIYHKDRAKKSKPHYSDFKEKLGNKHLSVNRFDFADDTEARKISIDARSDAKFQRWAVFRASLVLDDPKLDLLEAKLPSNKFHMNIELLDLVDSDDKQKVQRTHAQNLAKASVWVDCIPFQNPSP